MPAQGSWAFTDRSIDVFPQITIDGQSTSDWEIIRQTANFQTNGPIEDVTSEQLTCYELNPGNHGAGVMDVQAGATVCK